MDSEKLKLLLEMNWNTFGVSLDETLNWDSLRLVPIAEPDLIDLHSDDSTSSTSREELSRQREPSNFGEIIGTEQDQKQNRDLALDWLQALYDDDADAVKYLLENGPAPNFLVVVGGRYNNYWIIPLHEAVQKSLEVTKLLLDHGAPVDIIYKSSGTALQRAARHCPDDLKLSMARLLIEYGANVNAKPGFHGTTALIAATRENDMALARLLLDHGADPNEDSDPLICAAAYGKEDIARLLLARGADPSNAEHDWYEKYGAVTPRIPDYLKMWQMATIGDPFHTFGDLVNNLPGTVSDSDEFTLVLDWEVPEVISRAKITETDARKPIDFTQNVIFRASATSSHASRAIEGYNIEASSLSECLFTLRREDTDVELIYTIIELLNEVEFDGYESGRQYFIICILFPPI